MALSWSSFTGTPCSLAFVSTHAGKMLWCQDEQGAFGTKAAMLLCISRTALAAERRICSGSEAALERGARAKMPNRERGLYVNRMIELLVIFIR